MNKAHEERRGPRKPGAFLLPVPRCTPVRGAMIREAPDEVFPLEQGINPVREYPSGPTKAFRFLQGELTMKVAAIFILILMPLVCHGEVSTPVECSERVLTSPSSTEKSAWDAITNPRDVERCINALVSGINSDKRAVGDEAFLRKTIDNLSGRIERLEAELLRLKGAAPGK